MTYNKLVNGEVVPMTPEEITQRQAEEAAWLAARPEKEWQGRMAATDAKVTARIIEDLVDALQAANIAIPASVEAVMAERKTIRQQKPKG